MTICFIFNLETFGAEKSLKSTTANFSKPLDTLPITVSTAVHNVSNEIDRILHKIQQDNKLLAELDKSRSTTSESPIN